MLIIGTVLYCRTGEHLKAEEHSIVCIYQIFFIHSSVNGHLGCLHILVMVSNAAMDMGVQISEIRISILLGIYPEEGLLDYMVVLFSIFWGCSILFFHSDCPNLRSHWHCVCNYLGIQDQNLNFWILYSLVLWLGVLLFDCEACTDVQYSLVLSFFFSLYFLATPCGTQDLSSPPGDRTCTPSTGIMES